MAIKIDKQIVDYDVKTSLKVDSTGEEVSARYAGVFDIRSVRANACL